MTHRWLERAQEGTPVIEGDTATFVWQGEQAPQLIGDWTDWQYGEPVTLSQAAPDVWTHTVTLPRDAYLEYAYWQDSERVADPFNQRTRPDGFGNRNHYLYMPEAVPSALTRRRRHVPHGTLSRHVVETHDLAVGTRRTVYLYRPPVDQPCPLLVVLDGQDYRRRASLHNIVDNLIALGRIRPLALAMVSNHRKARMLEYGCNELTIGFLAELVLPLAQRELDLLDIADRPGAHGILGASMGGLMALYAGLRVPHLFGRVLSQSGAFTLDGHDTVVWELVRHAPVRPLRIWMDVGRYEWLLDCNRRLHELLVDRGYPVNYRELNAGHNYPAWRDDLSHGLEHLFGV